MIGWLMLAAASAAEPPPEPVQAPDWLRRPSRDDMMQVWPVEAMKRGQSGKAVIECDVSIHGALGGCHVLSEEPAGAGFGAAALALTPQFLMKPGMINGKPVVGGTARIPINFIAGDRVGPSHTVKVAASVAWSQAPTYAEMVAAYPKKARAQHVGGAATLSCKFAGDGRLADCRTTNEAPKALGFSTAAHSLVGKFRGPTKFDTGETTKGARTQLRFTFPVEMLDSTTPTIGKPGWVATPTAEELRGAIPAQAVVAGVTTARVSLSCAVVAEGRLDACEVVSEDPKGMGFDASTLNLAKAFRLTIWTDDGLPSVGGRVRIPVRFDIARPPPAPSAAP